LEAKIPALMAHHFGMFAFNTIDPGLIDQAATKMQNQLQLTKAEVGTRYLLKRGARGIRLRRSKRETNRGPQATSDKLSALPDTPPCA
jgi:hypothetical protein